ncbi:MAG: succinate dehydrogenase, cytochrome b556 subunit [Pseudomonadota bacterium]|uniref:succinate dehydrogenase, cytochrome b556 subunit n=1 Tax=Phenylobacterium sp. TaxID=1871053 RepID=UPI002723183D|nr:succinate dehydrogenase, cytochrome b556 subunit [Phenylobacterium sp.]MDO9429783.1 succinate dehydrogenase, cytochrome b556 subunit [Phenylobacterium sp.]
MTDAPRERPLSPHTTIWRWHVTAITSILHRATGCALYGGGLILAIWAITLAAGPEAYGTFKAVMGSPLGKVVLFGLTLSTFYHLAKGVQHLIWDAGTGYNLKTATMGSIAVIAFAIAATLAVWFIAAMTGAL